MQQINIFILTIVIGASLLIIEARPAKRADKSLEVLDSFIKNALNSYANGDDEPSEPLSDSGEARMAAANPFICKLVNCMMPYETCLAEVVEKGGDQASQRAAAATCHNTMKACSARCE